MRKGKRIGRMNMREKKNRGKSRNKEQNNKGNRVRMIKKRKLYQICAKEREGKEIGVDE